MQLNFKICNALKIVNKKYFEQTSLANFEYIYGNGVIVDDDGYLPLPQGNSQTSIDNTNINSNANDIIVEDINVPTKELKGKIMETCQIKPLKAVGYKGIFGLGTVIFGMIILHFTIGVHQSDGYFDIPAIVLS
ncbi:11402_t:CDS:2 [Entrophospora sp. SA101]|nr:11402_t:CDS:2 [Entrophospora sp. SA101]